MWSLTRIYSKNIFQTCRLYHTVIRLKGLPWTVTNQDIEKFLKDIKPKENGIHLERLPHYRRLAGKLTGNAFIEFDNEKDFISALKLNKKHIGERYIEVEPETLGNFKFAMRKQEGMMNDNVVKLRGLPFEATVEDVEKFFEGLKLKNGRDSIFLYTTKSGNTHSTGYVEFVSKEEALKALERDRQKLGRRYIEVFHATSKNQKATLALNAVKDMKIKKEEIS
ncbi:heterogeneous nuclear ribonucleoprotein H-like [Culicoides brevitarsis]|uniref:heterogeneous nuclear ribonucleoprotein H-like n=1 Tax=Culicoides brevitarsis TaxID=469753 RepID=UPI00307C41F6